MLMEQSTRQQNTCVYIDILTCNMRAGTVGVRGTNTWTASSEGTQGDTAMDPDTDRDRYIETQRDRQRDKHRDKRKSPAGKRNVKKRWSGEQVELAQRRQLEAFKSSIPSLQVAASFACSVASLSRSPAFQLPGHHHLHGEVLADHQFDWGGLSTCTAAHAQCLLTPSPSQNLQESPPSKS